MKIKVQDLGTIQEGEVDLDKNLIVFAGPNNSGKSYMAYLIYGILKILVVQKIIMIIIEKNI